MGSITQEWKAGQPAPGWREVLRPEFTKPYMQKLIAFLDEERRSYRIFPPAPQIFRAFTLTDFDAVRVCILGQDPYHTPGAANGLAFSAAPGQRIQPSLDNIFKEIADDFGTAPPRDGDLTRWATQGVFLINSALTAREGVANAHQGKGWEQFTGVAIDALSQRETPLVFMLWGRNALAQKARIDTARHLVLEAPHPSPLSAHRGFFGCRHFSKANEFLKSRGFAPITW